MLAESLSQLPAPAVDGESLDDYVAQALQANAGLKSRMQALEAARQNWAAARAKRLPLLEFGARYTQRDGGRQIDIPVGDLLNPVYAALNQLTHQPGAFPSIADQHIDLLRQQEQETRLMLTAPLWAPQLDAGIDAGRAQFLAERAAQESAARRLVREVKRAYYAAAQAEAGLRILEASERTLAEDQRVAESLVEAGKATRDRALRAQAERLAIEQQRDAQAAAFDHARRLLNQLRNRAPDAPLRLPRADEVVLPTSLSPSLPEAPLPRRPELRELDRALEAADAGERAARAAYQPTLALSAVAGYEGEDYDFDSRHDFNAVSLVATWALFDFGARRAVRAQSAAESEKLRAQRDDLERRLDLRHRAARDNLRVALRAVGTSEARLLAAEEVFRIARRKRESGSLSQIEFLDAERALTAARLGGVIARFAALDQAAELEWIEAAFELPAALRAEE